jgi:hypothetical protein
MTETLNSEQLILKYEKNIKRAENNIKRNKERIVEYKKKIKELKGETKYEKIERIEKWLIENGIEIHRYYDGIYDIIEESDDILCLKMVETLSGYGSRSSDNKYYLYFICKKCLKGETKYEKIIRHWKINEEVIKLRKEINEYNLNYNDMKDSYSNFDDIENYVIGVKKTCHDIFKERCIKT